MLDAHGLTISTTPQGAVAFDATIAAYLKYRADTPEHLERLLGTDPEFALGHCLKGYFALLGFKQAFVSKAAEAATAARSLVKSATTREQAHVAALEAWIAGDLDRTIAIWDQIAAEHPLDVLAIRLAHFVNFWLGRPQQMRASIESVLPKWSEVLPGYGTILSCRSFASEECGDYATAEAAGRAAVALDPRDIWGTHAIAHVMEMQGRNREGIAWLDELERHWAGGNNLLHHLWWHRALYCFEERDFDAVLDLYDRRFRDLGSPLTQAQPDLYIDVQNAASMLFRLERQGVDVGERWSELADKAEARVGDCLSAFTLPHWMMALTATGRTEAAERMLAGMRQDGGGTVGQIVARVAAPISEAILLRGRGEHARAVDVMRPALDQMATLGGSHAQQDVLEQLFLDSALRASRETDVRLILARVATRRDPARMVGFAEAAQRFM